MKTKLILCFLLFQSVLFSQELWHNLGPDDFNQATFAFIDYEDLALDQNDIPYLAFRDFNMTTDGKLTVRRFVNGQWENVGLPGFATNITGNISLAFDNNNVPHVAYSYSGSCYVKKFDGTSWVSVGSVNSGGSDLTLLFDSANAPHLGGRFGSSDIAAVKKYNGTSWVNLGTGNASPIYVQYVSFCLGQDDVPYLAYSDDYANNWKITVKKLNGTNWETVGPVGFSTGQARYINLAMDNNDVPYVAYENTNGTKKATIQKYNGTGWETVGAETVYANGLSNVQMAFDSANTPLVTYYCALGTVIKAFTYTFPDPDAGPVPAWAEIAPNFRGEAFSSFALDSQDKIYMGGRRVDKYDNINSVWNTLGPVDITGYEYPEESYMAVSADNNIYVGYTDFSAQTKVVKKWSGTAWNPVGAASLLGDTTGMANVVVAPDNVPYMLCGNDDGYLSVKKYNGTAWVNVGMVNFNPEPWVRASLAIDHNNVVYVTGVTYETNTYENEVHVWKNDQSSQLWSSTGITGIASLETEYNVDIAIGTDNMPYVAYLNNDDNDRLVVKKLNVSGYGWDLVGTGSVSDGQTIQPHIALNSQNVPYTTYLDGALHKITVKKFSGLDWELVGPAQFLGNVGRNRIAIDKNDVPYLSYYDGNGDSYDRITVSKFTGTEWATVGGEGFTASPSANNISEPILAFNPYNVPVVMCNTYGLYVKYFGGENAVSSTEALDYVNLQGPATMTFTAGNTATAYAQVLKTGVTEAAGPGEYISGWIGISTQNTNPSGWTTWIPATFNAQAGNNDEYQATLGAGLVGGTYYYASRFQVNGGPYKYGGYSTTGGGTWDGTTNNSGILTVTCSTVAPLANATQAFCNSATVANLQAEGNGIKWYGSSLGGLPLAGDVVIVSGTVYYASQTPAGGCESTRVPVTAIINSTPAPVFDVSTETQLVCNGATVADLTAEGTDIKWYTTMTGGEALDAATVLTDGFYYASQTLNGCESARVKITLNTLGVFTPQTSTTQVFCGSPTVASLVATGDGPINWYATPAGGTPLSNTVLLVNGSSYYVSQVLYGCESTRVMVTVTVNTTPVPQLEELVLCNGTTATALYTATNNSLFWYASATSTSTLNGATVLVSGTTYYASQVINLCESERVPVIVTLVTPTGAPGGATTQTINANIAEEATIEDLQVTLSDGATVVWYASEEDAFAGQDALPQGTQLANGATYYGVQVLNGCPSATVLAVTVQVILGTQDFNADAFTYYPNPVNDVFSFAYTATINTIEVYSIVGQLVMAKQVNQNSGQLNMQALAAGTYLVKVTAGDASKTIKIIKQ